MSDIPNLAVAGTAQRLVAGLVCGLGVAALLLLLRQTTAFERVELALVDARTRLLVGAERSPDSRIVIAEITDLDTNAALESDAVEWPWGYDVVQFLPIALKAAGAKGLVVDFLYLDRAVDHDELSERAQGNRGEAVAADRAAMGRYADALADFEHAVLGFSLTSQPNYERPGRVAVAKPLAFVQVDGEAPPKSFAAERADLSVRALLASKRPLGFVNTSDEVDGIVRHGVPTARWDGRVVPSLSLAGARLVEPDVVASKRSVRVGSKRQRLDHYGEFLLNFHAEAGHGYTQISPWQIILWGAAVADGEPLPEQASILKGKIVIFGAHLLANEDYVVSPIAERLHGVELQAVTIDNLLHGDGRTRVRPMWNYILLVLLCLALGLIGCWTKKRLLPVLVSLFAAVAVSVAAYLLFRTGYAIDLFTPWLAVLLTSVTASGYRLMTEGRRNKWLQGTFSRYLAPDVVKALQADPTRLQLGGRRRELTIMFSDVAGFTKMSEKLEAEDVVKLLNVYLTGQSEEVMSEDGVIDKFEGDAIMAFFGDPLDLEDHALRGCRTAVNCIRALPKLEPVWRELGLTSFTIRIGLNTGDALVGNMGSAKRFDYTCMGDTVNLASRLEGANKHFGSVIMIGPATYEQTQAHILAKPLGDLIVVGKSEPVAVYELLSLEEDASEPERRHVEAFLRAHQAVLDDDLPAARSALSNAEQLRPGDGPCAWLRGLIDGLEAGKTPRPWDRRVILTSK